MNLSQLNINHRGGGGVCSLQIHRKYKYKRLNFICIVLLEVQDRRLLQTINYPRKMLTSVKLSIPTEEIRHYLARRIHIKLITA